MGAASSYHAVSVVFLAAIDGPNEVRLDDQSLDWKFSNELPADFVIHSFDSRVSGNSTPNRTGISTERKKR
jgi:hypothetical protein